MNMTALKKVGLILVSWSLWLWAISGASTVHVSQSGIDFAACGSITEPCGTLYQASVLVNAMNASEIQVAVITVDGQNETEIVRHLSEADTGDYDPCLPVPLSDEIAIEIVFDALLVTAMVDWYPLSVCPDTNTLYANEYLFEGGKTISLTGLVVNDYSITDSKYYPIIKGHFLYFNSSVSCTDCVFERIVSSVTDADKPLIYGPVSLELHNTRWTDVECSSTSLLVSKVGFAGIVLDYHETIRVVAIHSSTFTNIRVADYVLAWQTNDGEPHISFADCSFTAIHSGVSLFRSDNFRDEVSISNSTFDLLAGSLAIFFNFQPSHISLEDVTITTGQQWYVGADYGLITVGASDVVTMTNVVMRYTYNVTAGCVLHSTPKNLTDDQQRSWREWTCVNAYMALLNEGGEVTMRNCELDTILTAVPVSSSVTESYEFETTVGTGFSALFVNDGTGILNLENFHLRRGLSRYVFRNQGSMHVFNFSTWYDEAEYSPLTVMSMAIFTSWGSTASMTLDASRITGFKAWAAMSFASAMYITNTAFEVGGWAVLSNSGTDISVINCTFSRVGGRYFGQLFPATGYVLPTVTVYLFRVGNSVLLNNRFSAFDRYGVVGSFESSGEMLIRNNIFTLDSRGAVFALPAENAAAMEEGRSVITLDGEHGSSEIIENVFELAAEDSNMLSYDASKHWILYHACGGGYHGTCGNTFTNAAIKVIGTNVTSCFRPNLIDCAHADIAYTDCLGDMNISLKDAQQQVTVTAEIDSVFHVESGGMALDHVRLTVMSTVADDVADPVIIKAVDSSVMLVDSFIADGEDISYNPDECDIMSNDRLRNASEYIAKLHLVCGNASENGVLENTLESDALRMVDSLSAVSIDVQASSSTYYPGLLLKINFTVSDELGNALDYQTTENLVIRLEGEGFLTDLTVLPSGVCSQCEQGVLINSLLVSENIGGTFTLQVTIVNDVLLSLNDAIVLNITGCPAGYGPDKNNATCNTCNNGYFNLVHASVEECRSCDPSSNRGVECADGDIMVVHNHWMGFHSTDGDEDDEDAADVSIISALCPTRLCCQDSGGCLYNEALSHVCAKNRDPSSKLCGACLPGYSESMNSAKCVQCKRSFHFEYLLLPIFWCVLLVLLVFFFSTESARKNGKQSDNEQRKEVAPPKNMCGALFSNRRFQFMLRTMVLKNIFYYQQAVTQILSTSTYSVLFFELAAQFDLSMTSVFLDADEDGLWCFMDGLGAKGKILIDLLIPVFILVSVTSVYAVSRFVLKRPLGFCSEKLRINFGKAYITTFLICIGKVLDVLFKIMSCQQVGNQYFHYYFGYETCYQTSWWLSFIIMIIIVTAFTFVFVHLKRMDEVERQSRSHPFNRFVSRYKPEFWYWEYILFLRRITIAMFAVSIQNVTAKLFFAAVLIIFTFVQQKYNPFQVQESNEMEFILLCALLFIEVTKLSPVFNSIAVNVVVSFLIVAPFLLLVYYSRQIYKTQILAKGNADDDEPITSVLSSSDGGPDINRVTSVSDAGIELQTANYMPRATDANDDDEQP